MKLVVTIDVEEEGLFSGNYHSHHVPVGNLANLDLLDPVFTDLGIRPTLLVTYQAVRHPMHRERLQSLKDKWDGEIGAHLHTWNTPPFEPSSYAEPVPSEKMPRKLLKAKLSTLLDAINKMGVDPVSFRMGRFNMGPRMFSVLEDTGIQIDSSIAPMRIYYGGPAHLSAPTDPYFPDPKNPLSKGNSRILEAPVTILPLIPKLGTFLEHLETDPILPRPWISWFSKYLGSLPAQPMLLGLRRLKLAVKMHRLRGGNTLTIFFHSSELFPGGCPQHRTSGDVERFLHKLKKYLSWLVMDRKAESVPLCDLYQSYCQAAPLAAGELSGEPL